MQERENNETILCDISIETGFQPTTSSTQKPEMTMSDFEREPLEENETSISPEDHSLIDFIYFDTSNIGTSIAQRKEYCASVGLPKNLADNKQLIKVLKDLNAKIRQKFNDEYCDIISNLKISNTRLAQTNEQLRDDLLNTKTYLQQISMLNQILLKKEQVNNDYAFAKELDEDGKTATQCHNSLSQFGETTTSEGTGQNLPREAEEPRDTALPNFPNNSLNKRQFKTTSMSQQRSSSDETLQTPQTQSQPQPKIKQPKEDRNPPTPHYVALNVNHSQENENLPPPQGPPSQPQFQDRIPANAPHHQNGKWNYGKYIPNKFNNTRWYQNNASNWNYHEKREHLNMNKPKYNYTGCFICNCSFHKHYDCPYYDQNRERRGRYSF